MGRNVAAEPVLGEGVKTTAPGYRRRHPALERLPQSPPGAAAESTAAPGRAAAELPLDLTDGLGSQEPLRKIGRNEGSRNSLDDADGLTQRSLGFLVASHTREESSEGSAPHPCFPRC